MDQIRSELTEQLKSRLADCQFGYVFPGHGLKGKQRVIENDSDIVAMYADYKGKRIITLWMKCSWKRPSAQRKRPHSPSVSDLPSTSKRSNYGSHLSKMTEVEVIMDKLKEKHKETYTPEQIRAWANMIHMRKYESYETPSDKPFFGKSRKKVLSTATEAVISPSKRLNMRSECIDQLDKWYKLMERGAMSPEQYKNYRQRSSRTSKSFKLLCATLRYQ